MQRPTPHLIMIDVVVCFMEKYGQNLLSYPIITIENVAMNREDSLEREMRYVYSNIKLSRVPHT